MARAAAGGLSMVVVYSLRPILGGRRELQAGVGGCYGEGSHVQEEAGIG